MSLKFSPNYTGDNTLVAVFSDMAGTYLTAGVHDIVANVTDWAAIYKNGRVEITTKGAGSSPMANQIISADRGTALAGILARLFSLAGILSALIARPALPVFSALMIPHAIS